MKHDELEDVKPFGYSISELSRPLQRMISPPAGGQYENIKHGSFRNSHTAATAAAFLLPDSPTPTSQTETRTGVAMRRYNIHQQAEIQREGNLHVVICCIVQHTNTTKSFE
ncbi:hypothetical protein MC179_003184 [Salmonella enterica]|nr:hypothetical protein [Salmonella enterica]